MDQLQHRALLEDLHAQGLCKPGFAEDQVQRVQMARTHVDKPAGIHVRVDHLPGNLPGLDQSGFVGVAGLVELGVFGLEPGKLRRGVGQFAKTPAQVAIDAVLPDSPGHQFN
ncbi:hypothetical protein D3C76_1517510 [compost metagenome]